MLTFKVAVSYCLSLFLALLQFPHAVSADVVLGGVVDYNPRCYGDGRFHVIIEYNGAYNEDSRHYRGINEVLLREKLTDPNGLYNGETFLADSYHKTIAINGYSNYAITQRFIFTNPQTNMFAISLRKGIRMIRIPFLREGQAPGWQQGIQIRFTSKTMRLLVEKFVREFKQGNEMPYKNRAFDYRFTRENGLVSSFYDLNVHIPCMIINGAIPYYRRNEESQLIKCLYVTAAKHDPNRPESSVRQPIYNPTVNVDNCDLSTKYEVVRDPLPPLTIEQRLLGYLKDIVTLGISHVPYVGAFLAIGVDVLAKFIENKESTRSIMQSAGIDTAKVGFDTIFSSFVEVYSKKVAR